MPRAIRAIYFDKSPDQNWLVPWHQDLTIAVRSRIALTGFGPWSMKDGVPHVQPPIEILENIITLRLHLDDCDERNGALRVLPGSHRQGQLTPSEILAFQSTVPEFICNASAGDALLMRPLLLHASSRSQASRHRRVLHIEYAGCELPVGLEWRTP
jgi:ectoine hydroxylase-related dioxygenase (phytanoyl-CoA dioxygenase family)